MGPAASWGHPQPATAMGATSRGIDGRTASRDLKALFPSTGRIRDRPEAAKAKQGQTLQMEREAKTDLTSCW